MLNARHVIVTGATTGIGKELVKKFARAGARVTVGHNLEGSALEAAEKDVHNISVEAKNDHVGLVYLDMADFDSVRRFASRVDDCHILVNNAGIMSNEQKKRDGIELTMLTNFLGPFLLSNLLVPVMENCSERDQTECRIVNLTSSSESKAEAFPGRDPLGQSAIRGDLPDSVSTRQKVSKENFFGMLSNTNWIRDGPFPYFMLPAYANASLCTILTTNELSRRIESKQLKIKEKYGECKHRISVNSVCPGYVNTNIWKSLSWFWTPFRYFIFKTPEKGSEIIYDLATSEEYVGVSGNFISTIEGNDPSDMAKSQEMAITVWEESCKLVGLNVDDINGK